MASPVTKEMLREIQANLEGVAHLQFESALDSTGEPASWIWIVLEADAPKKIWSWENRESIRSRVMDELKKGGVTDWIYVRFRSTDEAAASATVNST